MKFIAFINLSNKVLYVIFLFAIVRGEDDYVLVPIISAASSCVSLIIACYIIRNHFNMKFSFPRLKLIGAQLIVGRHAFLAQLAPNLYNNSAIFLLGIYTSNIVVGQYTAAMRVIEAVKAACYILTNAFLPYLARNISNHKYFVKIMLVVGVVLSSACFFLSEFITTILYAVEPGVISRTISFLSPWVLFVFIINIYGPAYLMLTGNDRTYKNIVLYVSVVAFVVALLAIPAFAIVGAVGVILGASFLMCVLCYLSFLKLRKNHS